MSSHRKHSRHRDHSNEDNIKDNNKDINVENVDRAESIENVENKSGSSSFDSSNIADLLSSIKPEDLTSLLSNFNLGSLKTVNKTENPPEDEVIKEAQIDSKPSDAGVQDKSTRNTTLEFLLALKPLVSYERGLILDKMLQIYSIGSIFKK